MIDMSAFTGMPGLIDIHTHMTYWWSGNPHTTPNAETARLLPQELVFMAQENARKTLDIGVTTVRDMLAKNYSDIAMRNLINRGAMVGPRMFVAGPALLAGGPALRYGDVFPWTVPRQGQVSGTDGVMRRSARRSPPAWTSLKCLHPPEDLTMSIHIRLLLPRKSKRRW